MDACDVNKRSLAEVLSVVSTLVSEEEGPWGCSRGHRSWSVAQQSPPDTHPQPPAQEHRVRLLLTLGSPPKCHHSRDVFPGYPIKGKHGAPSPSSSHCSHLVSSRHSTHLKSRPGSPSCPFSPQEYQSQAHRAAMVTATSSGLNRSQAPERHLVNIC